MPTRLAHAAVLLAGAALADPLFADATATHYPARDPSHRSMDAAAGDVDGDGDMDLLVAMEFTPNRLLVNDGTGRFADESEARLPRTAFDSEEIALADFDRDGDLDAVIACEDDQRKSYFQNDGKGVFADVSDRLAQTATSNGVEAGDYDGDGDLDLALANAGPDVLLIGDGQGGFDDESTARLPRSADVTQDFTAADLDGDGDLDLVMGNEDGNKILINDGSGRFADETAARLPPPPGPEMTRKAAAGDADGDGDADLYFANVAFAEGLVPQDRLLINDGEGRFADETDPRLPPAPDAQNTHAGFHDLDLDGDLDLAVTELTGVREAGTARLRALINDGAGVFADRTADVFPETAVGNGFDLVEADFDGDGRADLFMANRIGPDVLLLRR